MLRVFTSGTRAYASERAVHGRRRSATIGDAETLMVPQARRETRKLIADFLEPARNDNGSGTLGHPMTTFAEEFLDRQTHCGKPRTGETNAHLVHKYILPTFGSITVDAITAEQVADWFASMSDSPGVANRSMPVLSTTMKMAEL